MNDALHVTGTLPFPPQGGQPGNAPNFEPANAPQLEHRPQEAALGPHNLKAYGHFRIRQ